MSSHQRTPTRSPRADWQPSKRPGSAKYLRLKRFLAALALVTLTGLFGFLVYRLWPDSVHTFRLAAFYVEQNDLDLGLPSLAHARKDLEALQALAPPAEGPNSDTLQGSTDRGPSQRAEGLEDWMNNIASASADTLVVYLAAHVLPHDDKLHVLGNAFAGSRESLSQQPRFETLLENVAKAKAKIKLVCLDLGPLDWAPRFGMLANSAPLLLQKLSSSEQYADSRTFVLVSHQATEYSHISWPDRRSVFGYFVCEALRGHADSDGNRVVSLGEMARFVQSQVSQFVWNSTDKAATQRPLLLELGKGPIVLDSAGAGSLDRFVLTTLARGENMEAAATPAEAATAPASADTKKAASSAAKGSLPTADSSNEPPTAAGESPDQKKRPSGETGEKKESRKGEAERTGELPASGNANDTSPPPATASGSDSPGDAVSPPVAPPEAAASAPVPEPLNLEGLPEFSRRLALFAQRAERESERQPWSMQDQAPHCWMHLWAKFLASQNAYLSGENADNPGSRPRETLEDLERGMQQWSTQRSIQYDLPDHDQQEPLRQALQQANETLFKLHWYLQLAQGGVIDDVASLDLLIDQLKALLPTFAKPLAIDARDLQDDESLIETAVERARNLREYGNDIEKNLTSDAGDLPRRFLLMDTPLPDTGERVAFLRDFLAAKPVLQVKDVQPVPPAEIHRREQKRLERILVVTSQLQSIMALARGEELSSQRDVRACLDGADYSADTVFALLSAAGLEIWEAYDELVKKVTDQLSDVRAPDLCLRMVDAYDWQTIDAGLGRRPIVVPIRLAQRHAAELKLQSPSVPAGERLPTSGASYRWTLTGAPELMPSELTVEFLHADPDVEILPTDAETPLSASQCRWLVPPAARAAGQFEVSARIVPRNESGHETEVLLRVPSLGLQSLPLTLLLPESRMVDVLLVAQGPTAEPSERLLRMGNGMLRVVFDPEARSVLTLRPFPSLTTPFRLKLHNPRSAEWSVRYSIQSNGQSLLSEAVLKLPAGGEVDLPLFPSATVEEPKEEQPKNGAKENPAGNKPAPQDDNGKQYPCTSPLLLVLEPEGGLRQELLLQCQPLHPREYLRVASRIENETRRIKVTIEPLDRESLPPRPIRILWPIEEDEKTRFDELPQMDATVDFHAAPIVGNPLELMTAILGRETREIPVVLSVDGYPRAFRLIQKLSGAGQIVDPDEGRLRLALADAAGNPQKDDKGNIVWLADEAAVRTVERLYAQYEVDIPRIAWESYEVAVFVVPPTGGENLLAERALRFLTDRIFHLSLKPDPSDSGQFLVQTEVLDLAGTLDVKGLEERLIRVKGQVRAIPRQASATPVSRSRDRSVTRGVYVDTLKPTAKVVQQPFRVMAGEPTWIPVVAEDVGNEGSGVAGVLYGSADAQGNLQDPQSARATDDARLFSVPFMAEKAGRSSLYVAAVDRAGNQGRAVQVTILAEAVAPKKEIVPNGSLKIRVVGDRARYNFLVQLQGPKSLQVPMEEDGTKEIRDLPAGTYSVSASGKIKGFSSVKYKTNEQKVEVMPGKSVEVLLTAEQE